MNNNKLTIVLVAPEIPGNTGSIGRTCVSLNARLVLIKPYGFELSEKSVRRAGLDYWKHVDLTEYNSWDEFVSCENIAPENCFFFSRFGKKHLYEITIKENSYLIFGQESKGLPESIVSKFQDQLVSIPSFSDKIRSLNLANAVGIASYEAIRQIKFTT